MIGCSLLLDDGASSSCWKPTSQNLVGRYFSTSQNLAGRYFSTSQILLGATSRPR
jgi:hypothetical protein